MIQLELSREFITLLGEKKLVNILGNKPTLVAKIWYKTSLKNLYFVVKLKILKICIKNSLGCLNYLLCSGNEA